MTPLLKRFFKVCAFLAFSFQGVMALGKTLPEKYGLPPFSEQVHAQINARYEAMLDSVFAAHPQLGNKHIINAIVHPHIYDNRTADFYLIILLCVFLGFIRVSDPRYFQSLWLAFKNPSTSGRQFKEKLKGASMTNLLMNIFFTMSVAAYGYFVVKNFIPRHSGSIPPVLLLLMLVGGMMVVYIGKYLVIRFSGWAFRVEGVTEHYLFNVFLVNKILGIVLLPLIVLLAFADQAVAQPALIISFLLILFLFINRYLRSWQVFGSFFQYSKFHFFTYLCASELLPLAVLMKLLVRGLLY